MIKVKNPNAPRLRHGKYRSSPPMDEIRCLPDDMLEKLPDFMIANEYAKVEFLDPVDVRRLELDRIILLE